MSRFNPFDLTPAEISQASKGTLDAHWKRAWRLCSRAENWRLYRLTDGCAQCRDCGYFWTLENLEVKPNPNGYLAQCLACHLRAVDSPVLAAMRKGHDDGGRRRR